MDTRSLKKRCVVWWASISVVTFGWYGLKLMFNYIKVWLHLDLCQSFEMLVLVWGFFSWHTLETFVLIKDYLNVAAYLGMLSDHVPQFITTVNLSSGWHFKLFHWLKTEPDSFTAMRILYSNSLSTLILDIRQTIQNKWWTL